MHDSLRLQPKDPFLPDESGFGNFHWLLAKEANQRLNLRPDQRQFGVGLRHSSGNSKGMTKTDHARQTSVRPDAAVLHLWWVCQKVVSELFGPKHPWGTLQSAATSQNRAGGMYLHIG